MVSRTEIPWMSAMDMAAAIRGGELSSREIADGTVRCSALARFRW